MILKSDLASAEIKLKSSGFPEGCLLPGIVQSISVYGAVKVDSSSSAPDKGAAKTSRGLENKTISISLLIVGRTKDDAYTQLETLEAIFQEANKDLPNVFKIENKHLKGRRVAQMLFQSFSSSENSSGDAITVSLNFEEFVEAEAADKARDKNADQKS